MTRLTAWSFSRWQKYRTCPFSAFLAYIEKVVEEKGPPLIRGQEIHSALERYLKGELDRIPEEALTFKRQLMALKRAPGMRSEEEWAFRRDWSECSWFAKDCWLRVKVDARYGRRDLGLLTIVDFKTGSRPPKNIHTDQSGMDQRELYALAAIKKFGESVKVVEVEYWYLDRPEDSNIARSAFDATEPGLVDRLTKKWEKRAEQFLGDELWEKRPGYHCRWCSFNVTKGGPCDPTPQEEHDDGGF